MKMMFCFVSKHIVWWTKELMMNIKTMIEIDDNRK